MSLEHLDVRHLRRYSPEELESYFEIGEPYAREKLKLLQGVIKHFDMLTDGDLSLEDICSKLKISTITAREYMKTLRRHCTSGEGEKAWGKLNKLSYEFPGVSTPHFKEFQHLVLGIDLRWDLTSLDDLADDNPYIRVMEFLGEWHPQHWKLSKMAEVAGDGTIKSKLDVLEIFGIVRSFNKRDNPRYILTEQGETLYNRMKRYGVFPKEG